MICAPGSPDWLQRPWAEAWLAFNLCPSQLVHPTRTVQWLPAALAPLVGEPAVAAALHRHWSSHLLRQPGFEPAQDIQDPVLPLALADAALWDRLVTWCGLVVAGGAVRQVIAREEVALLVSRVGAPALDFARRGAARLWPGPRDPATGLQADPLAGPPRLGAALLAAALGQAGTPVATRTRLRLPAGCEADQTELPPALQPAPAACRLARLVLMELDDSWLSSFPMPH